MLKSSGRQWKNKKSFWLLRGHWYPAEMHCTESQWVLVASWGFLWLESLQKPSQREQSPSIEPVWELLAMFIPTLLLLTLWEMKGWEEWRKLPSSHCAAQTSQRCIGPFSLWHRAGTSAGDVSPCIQRGFFASWNFLGVGKKNDTVMEWEREHSRLLLKLLKTVQVPRWISSASVAAPCVWSVADKGWAPLLGDKPMTCLSPTPASLPPQNSHYHLDDL